MKKFIKYFPFIITAFIFFACANEFEPYANLRSGYMLFCLLDNRTGTQIAALQKMHFPNGDRDMPANAQIVLSENNGKNYYFRDTVISGNQNYSFYCLHDFKPVSGKIYRLSAYSDSMEFQYGQITYCNKTIIKMTEDTAGFSSNNLLFTNKDCSYYTFNMYIKYRVNTNGSITSAVEEVPYSLSDYKCPDSVLNLGPALIAAYIDSVWEKTEKKIIPAFPGLYSFPQSLDNPHQYSRYSIFYALRNILKKEPNPENVTIEKIILVSSALYDPLAGTRQNINSYVDYSIRLGEHVNLTNLISENGEGYGYLGAIIGDTFTIKYNTEIYKYFGFKY